MIYQTLIEASELADHLSDSGWRVFDCRFDLADTGRGEREYAVSHLPGAWYAHLDRDLSGPITAVSGRHPLPDTARLRRWLGDHGIAPDTQVVAYDDTGGNMAVRLWWLLRWLGHERVALLNGGWQAWRTASLPITAEPPAPPTAVAFDGAPDWGQVVDSAAILDSLGSPSAPLLIDARTGERFRGEAEPIDPVAGHVPGAVNLPLQENLATDGRFKSANELRDLYLRVLGTRPPTAAAAMCGSGVTACHNLLAMEIAGLHGGRLYAGSWSEWIREPGRPVATGSG